MKQQQVSRGRAFMATYRELTRASRCVFLSSQISNRNVTQTWRSLYNSFAVSNGLPNRADGRAVEAGEKTRSSLRYPT